jgi:predicted metal-dependent phosphoesterase TrpH
MLTFMRNKLISIYQFDEDRLVVHGILDDDIYSVELDIHFRMSDLMILTIDGKWNRWTTPECPRSLMHLSEAEGMSMMEEGFRQKINKLVGRKSCRHFANLLLDMCHSAREASWIAEWEKTRETQPDLTFDRYLSGRLSETQASTQTASTIQPVATRKVEARPFILAEKPAGGTLVDLHCHSYPASPCSNMTVDQLVVEARRIGLDAVCLTEHNHVWPKDVVAALREKHGFLVLRGNEITTDQGDVLVFGFHEDIKGIIRLMDLRAKVEAAGGVMIVAHPFRGFLVFGVGRTGLTVEKAIEREMFKCVDAVEIMNGKVTAKENDFSARVAAGLNLPGTGGSDAHEIVEIGKYATWFPGKVTCEADLLSALKKGDFQAVAYRRPPAAAGEEQPPA